MIKSERFIFKFSIFILFVYYIDAVADMELTHVREGHNVTLTCLPVPNLIMNWQYYNDNTLRTIIAVNEYILHDRLTVVYNPTEAVYALTLLFFNETDSGNYRCFSSTLEVNKYFRINVAVAPVPLLKVNGVDDDNSNWVENEIKNVTCEFVDGIPPGNVTLSKNGVQLGSGTVSVSRNISLPRSSNQTVIQCAAINIATDDPVVKEIVPNLLYGALNTEMSFQPDQISEGDDVILECTSFSNPPPTYSIFKEVGTVPSVVSASLLKIFNISRSQAGKYYCLAGNKYNKETVDVNITVRFAPGVGVTTPSDVREGDDAVTISCTATGIPAQYNFGQWVQLGPDDQTPIRVMDGVQNDSTFYYTFGIPVTFQDSGYYKCTVDNEVQDLNGNLYQMQTKELTIKGIPHIYEGDRYIIGHVGHSASLQVDFSSYPIYSQVTWFVNAADSQDIITVNLNERFEKRIEIETIITEIYGVTVNVSGYVAKLVIKNVTKYNFGIYHVVIVNEIGQSQISVELTGTSEPDIPTKFGIEMIAATSVTVTWDPGDNGGVSQTFYIQYRETSTDGTEQQWQEHGVPEIQNARMYTEQITGLLASTKYDFRIYARNEVGESDKTGTFIVKTEELVQPSTKDDSIIGIVVGSVSGVLLIIAIIVMSVLWKRGVLKSPMAVLKKKEESPHVYQNRSFAVGEDLANDDKEKVYQEIGPSENPIMHYQSLENMTTDRTEPSKTSRDSTYINA